jgi:hypothetical protein
VGKNERTASTAQGPKRAFISRGYHLLRQFVWFGLLLVGLVWFMGSSTSEFGPVTGWILALAGFWLVIFIHELGHAAAALACGWKVAVFVAGNLGFHIHNREFAWVPRSKRLKLAGFVVPYPGSTEVWTKRRSILIHAGGPAASLVFAALLATTAVMLANRGQSNGFDVSRLAAGLALFSFGTALMTLTPSGPGKPASDGQNIVRSLRRLEPEWLQTRGLVRLHALTSQNVRLRDLPSWMIEEAQTAAKNNDILGRAVAALIIGIVLDTLPVDIQSARELIDEFRRSNGNNAWLACCDAYFTATWENDAIRGRALLWNEEVEEDLKPLALAAEAAVLAREGDQLRAKQLLIAMRTEVARKSAFTDLTFRDIERQIERSMTKSS